jgi:hypothetical protein
MLVKPKSEEDRPPKVEEIPPFNPIVPEKVAAARPSAPADDEQTKLDEQLRSAKSLREFPLAMTAGEIEYFYAKGKRRAIVRGNPQARQEMPGARWRQFWGDNALWDAEKDLLRVNSRPGQRDARMKTSIGDDLMALWFECSTEEGNDAYSGEGITGTVVSDDEDLPPPAEGATKPPPGALRGPIGGAR